jgi:hypothetical protein
MLKSFYLSSNEYKFCFLGNRISFADDLLRVLTCVFDHIVKCSFLQDQLLRRTCFPNLSHVHHGHLVIVSDCQQSMSNRDHCRICKFLSNHLLNECVSLHVHICYSVGEPEPSTAIDADQPRKMKKRYRYMCPANL